MAYFDNEKNVNSAFGYKLKVFNPLVLLIKIYKKRSVSLEYQPHSIDHNTLFIMPVNLPAIADQILHPVKGIRLGWTKGEIAKKDRKDVLIIDIADGSSVAGVFTLNRFCAAPVTLCKQHLQTTTAIKAFVINTGNANAGTGEQGMNDAIATCQTVAEVLNVSPESVLPFSTGVILEFLPMDRLLAAIPKAAANFSEDHWHDAAQAIMTTDIVPKAYSTQLTIDDKLITITGISKGSGMIHPNMATMLGYLTTDAGISQSLLDEVTKEIADVSFNCISVDGDTSTNDSFMIVATNQSDLPKFTSRNDLGFKEVYQQLLEAAQYLAQAIVRDGEGATKFVTIAVEGAKNIEEAKAVGFSISKSPLVKTALFASDPNLGRVLAAIGYSTRDCASLEDLNTDTISLYFGDVLVAENGGRASSYQEEMGQEIMNGSEIDIRVKLNRGEAKTTIWTCDFSYDYVKINAEYRT